MICIIWYLVIYLLELTILCSTRIYKNYFLGTRNTLKRYAEIGRYRNIPFHWTNQNGVWNGINNNGLAQHHIKKRAGGAVSHNVFSK